MSDKYAALKQAAQEEIMCRESGDTSDAWQDEASPEFILELLAERDADKRRIAELESEIKAATERYENRTPTEWAYAQACAAINKHRSRAETAEQRIAELEARTLTVKLPPEVQWSNIPFAADGANAMRKEVVKALTEACAAAGISLKIEGE